MCFLKYTKSNFPQVHVLIILILEPKHLLFWYFSPIETKQNSIVCNAFLGTKHGLHCLKYDLLH